MSDDAEKIRAHTREAIDRLFNLSLTWHEIRELNQIQTLMDAGGVPKLADLKLIHDLLQEKV